MIEGNKPSYIQQLFNTEAYVRGIGEQPKKSVTSVLKVVDGQIKQVSEGNPITSDGVTKSGKEN